LFFIYLFYHCWGNPELLEEIGDTYGQKGATAEQDVNKLYKPHFLMAYYKAYDERCLKYLHGLVANIDEGVDVKREVLSNFIKTVAGNTH
jgi:hypothetical protein